MSIENYFKESKVLLLLSSTNDKKSMKIFFKELGVPLNNIIVSDPTIDWKKEIITHKPNIFIISNKEEGKDFTEYLDFYEMKTDDLHRCMKIIINDTGSKYMESMKVNYQIDLIAQKPYTPNEIKETIAKVAETKANPGEDQKVLSQCFRLLKNTEIDRLDELLNKHEDIIKENHEYFYFKSHVLLENDLVDKAIENLKQGLDRFDHVPSFNLIIQLLAEQKDYKSAKTYTMSLIKTKSVERKTFIPLIKCAIANRNFNLIEEIRSFLDPDELREETKTVLAAGLLMHAKNCIQQDEAQKAIETLKDAIKLSDKNEMVKSNCLDTLINIGEQDYVDQYLTNLSPDDMTVEMQIVDLKLSSITENPYKTLEKGSNLLKKSVKDYSIYEIMIKKSVEANRDGKVIEQLAFEAQKHFPENESKIKAIIKH
jgi:tetratricopeptide (TPR) repeat protein